VQEDQQEQQQQPHRHQPAGARAAANLGRRRPRAPSTRPRWRGTEAATSPPPPEKRECGRPSGLPGCCSFSGGRRNKKTRARPSTPAHVHHTLTHTPNHPQPQQPHAKYSISVTFISDKDGSEQTVTTAAIGKSLLEVAHDHDVELEGACEGSLACSTCHVILEQDAYDKLEEPCEDELDMLDLAFGLTPTSRLGCQVLASRELDGLRVRLPSATRNFYVGEEGAEGGAAASAGGTASQPAATK
jgi:ferredoxin-2, mitochondrial